MTREDVIMMADASAFHTAVQEGELMRFAELVAKAERKRICDMLLNMHAEEKNHNYYGYIANIIRESV